MLKRKFTSPFLFISICILGTVLAVIWQEWNAKVLDHQEPNRYGVIYTADEPSYFAPPRNLLETGEWKDNSNGITAYYQRPPGYGGIYLLCEILLKDKAYLGLKVIQIASFFGSSWLFFLILQGLEMRKRWIIVALSLYVVLPVYSGFMYYGLTESITPFLLLLHIYSWFLIDKKENRGWLLALSTGLLLITRPQLLIFPLCWGIWKLFKRDWRAMRYLLIGILPFLFWNIRTMVLSPEPISLHPIYSTQNNTLFRPPHEAFTNLYRVWEADGEIFHRHMGQMGKNETLNLDLLKSELPKRYVQVVLPLLSEYNQVRLNQKKMTGEINGYLIGEEELTHKIKATRSKLIKENRLQYYFLTPLASLKKLVVNSHLNLNLFQGELRGKVWMEGLRWFSAGIIFLSILLTMISGFVIKGKQLVTLLMLGCTIMLFYLAYVQRMNEERYLTPILPIFLLISTVFIHSLFKEKIRKTNA